MEKEHLAQVVCECLHLDCPEPDLADWTEMVEKLRHPTQEVTVALVGKYIQLHDAYISAVEALKHGGITAIQLSISNGSTLKQLLLKMPKSYLLMSAVFLFLADLATAV